MGLKQLAVREKGLVGQLGLVLGVYPVPGFMESHAMLQDHDLSIAWVLGLENLHWEMRVVMWVFEAWIPSSGGWYTSNRSLSQKSME